MLSLAALGRAGAKRRCVRKVSRSTSDSSKRRLGLLGHVGRCGVPLVVYDPLVVGLLLTKFGLSGLVNRLKTVQDVVNPGLPGRLVGSWQVQPDRSSSSIGLNAVAWRYESVIRGQSGLTLASTGHSLLRAVCRPGRWFAATSDLRLPPRDLLLQLCLRAC